MNFKLTSQDIPHYTYKDYELWEGDWELIKGFPYSMSPAPNWKQQEFGNRFVTMFSNEIEKDKQCTCKVLYECDWIINDDTIVRPDVMITCEIIEGNYPTKPPGLILEILSPQSLLKDRNTKFNLYQSYGVKYYIIASVDKKEIEIYQLKNNKYKEVSNLSVFSFEKDCSVTIDLIKLFK